MRLSRKYIMEFRTDAGAWTGPQIEALGISWPPRHGWVDRLAGKEISAINQQIFESKVSAKQFRRQQMNKSFELDIVRNAREAGL